MTTVQELTYAEQYAQREKKQRAAYIAGLRQIADFLAAHPEVKLPHLGGDEMNIFLHGAEQRDKFTAIARAMGRAEKSVWEFNEQQRMEIKRKFAGLTLVASIEREAVCERIVTGTAEVTTEVPDPELLAAVPKVQRTEIVETVEWRCTPLLAESTQAAHGELVRA
jgi:hypothetical protein